MSPEALQQVFRLGPTAGPVRVLHSHVTLNSSRGGCPLEAERTAMQEIGLDFRVPK